MDKIFFQKNANSSVVSNLKVKLGTKKSVELEVSEDDKKKILQGTHILDIDKDNLPVITERPPKALSAKQATIKIIKAKLDDGSATLADVKEALKAIL